MIGPAGLAGPGDSQVGLERFSFLDVPNVLNKYNRDIFFWTTSPPSPRQAHQETEGSSGQIFSRPHGTGRRPAERLDRPGWTTCRAASLDSPTSANWEVLRMDFLSNLSILGTVT